MQEAEARPPKRFDISPRIEYSKEELRLASRKNQRKRGWLKSESHPLFCISIRYGLFFLVSPVEFVDAAGSVHELHLSCIERVRRIRDLDLHNRVFNTLNLDGLLSVCARTCDEDHIIRHILESYKTVVFGMTLCIIDLQDEMEYGIPILLQAAFAILASAASILMRTIILRACNHTRRCRRVPPQS